MKFSHLSMLLTVFGEAIIIACFLLFGNPGPEKYLCMVVTSVIYVLWCGQAFIPWINLKDKTSKEVGSLGIRWYGIIFYSIFAIAAMLCCNLFEVSFSVQFIIHLVLLFLLFAFLIAGKGVEGKVASVHKKEDALTEKKDVLKFALNNLRRKLSAKSDFPKWILERVAKMEDEARYLSPNNSTQAQSLDNSFAESLKALETKLDFGNLEQVEIGELLKMCEITLTERKKVLN